VFGPMQWGPVRNAARKVYDLLGLHGKVSLPQSVNWAKTKAFTTIRTTGEGVSINLAGRDPDGIVDPGDFEKVRGDVMDALSSFVDPKTGKKPVKAIFKREEIFKGRHADAAPDIIMEPAEGYSLTHAKSAIEDADWVSGDHRIEGTIVAVGPDVKPFEQPPLLIDMAPTILAALDAPASIEPTGRVLTELIGSKASVRAEAPVVIPGMGGSDEPTVSDTEAGEMEEHLRGLGYLE
jgi:predicted AlkP superfamily phosphohydrolase/phosphomutase